MYTAGLQHLYRDFASRSAGVSNDAAGSAGGAGIVMVSIPLSLAGGMTRSSFWTNSAIRFQLQVRVALGLLVTTIVVTENIARHLRDGGPAERAAAVPAQEIFVEVWVVRNVVCAFRR